MENSVTHRQASGKNKNTEDQLTYFAQKIENGFQEGKKTVAVFF